MFPQSELTELLSKAILLATEAHAGQFDKQGQPYILHPIRVMLRLTAPGLRVIGVLHDVLEDCPDFREQALALLDPTMTEVLLAVTKDPTGGELYKDYIRRVYADGPGARKVKLADLADNSDPDRAYDEHVVGMIADRYVWASALLATGNEEWANLRKTQAKIAWRYQGEHPGKFVLTEPTKLRICVE